MLSSRVQTIGLDGHFFPTKTPIRLKGRSENAGSKTVGPKGKNTALRTPFAPVSARNVASFKYPETQRPSSTRKHARSRKSGSQKFETPLNNGRHWDVGDVSLEVPMPEVQDTILEDNDLDEVEYMAPNTLDIPYQPPVDFDLPDYKVLGETFRRQAFSALQEDVQPPDFALPSMNKEDESWNLLALRELDDDDPFRVQQGATAKPVTTTLPSKPVPRARPLSTLPPSTAVRSVTTTGKPRPATAASTVNAKTPLRTVSTTQPGSRRLTSTTSKPRIPSAEPKSSLKPTTRTNKPPIAKMTPVSRPAVPARAAGSASSTSRSTPITRILQPNKKLDEREPTLFSAVPLELDDDFMFEV